MGAGSVMNAISRMSPPQLGHAWGNSSSHPRHELGLVNPRRVVGAMFRIRVTALVRRVTSPCFAALPIAGAVTAVRSR
jgi:hypothetical protein